MAICVFLPKKRRNKADLKWQGPGIVIGRFGREGDLVYFSGTSFGVDLNDLRSANHIFDAIGCDGALRLHLAKANPRFAIWRIPKRCCF